MLQKCPKCGFAEVSGADCPKCGINLEGYRRYLSHHVNLPAPPPRAAVATSPLLQNVSSLCVQQQEDALRIFTGWPTCNQYTLTTPEGQPIGFMAEKQGGFLSLLARLFCRNGRPFTLDVVDLEGRPLATFQRPFFLMFPRTVAVAPDGRLLGEVRKSWGVLRHYYYLHDARGAEFAELVDSLFGGRTFGDVLLGNDTYGVKGPGGSDLAFVARKWNGVLSRVFTDKDTYLVGFSPSWSAEQNILLLAAAVSIDFDHYENNVGVAEKLGISGGLLSNLFSLFSGRD